MGVGACNKANADTVKTCLIPIPVYNMCINQHMEQVGKKKLEVLNDITKEVNESAKIDGIENDVLVVVSDIEGRAKDFLVKLKHAGVIDGVEVDKETGKLKIHLNENFCGTIDFCGDLTSYKGDLVPPFGNEIVIEVFEELLEQIKAHNEGKKKDKQIQFVAVPGNHEFYRFWGLDDDKAIYSRDDGGKNPLLIKLKSLKVIAKIQKYFLEQVQKNKDDITDDDYQGTDVKINEKIKSLDKESEMLDTIYNVLSGKGADLGDGFYYDFINYKDRKDELQKEKDCFKNGYFMINTKEGKITNDERTNKNNQFGFKSITKEDLEKIFKDEVCYLPFDEILKILKSNGKYQENSSDDTEWTAELINEKLNDLKKVLKNEDFVFNIEQWPYYKYDLAKQLTAIKNLETKLESFKTTTQELKQQLSQDGYIEQGEIKDENPISVFRPLLWDKSALLSKIVFNHRGKKFRTLHHFGLFVPEGCSVDDLTKDNQKNIFADAFSTLNYFNVRAINDRDLRYLKRDIFENNKIPTLFGHEGKWSPGAQTSEMYCVDTRHCDDLNVVCVVDSNNNVKETISYYPFGSEMRIQEPGQLPQLADAGSHPFRFTGKELDRQNGLNMYDFGARWFDVAGVPMWTSVDPLAEKNPSLTPYHFCHNDPVNRTDSDGKWDVNVHLAKDRRTNGYGVAVISDRNGQEIFRFIVRAEGVKGHDRRKTGGDTPLGTYDIPNNNAWTNGKSRLSYGPNDRLVMNPESGEIVESGRNEIRIHGGRQEIQNPDGTWQRKENAKLEKTFGCLRASDEDMKTFKTFTDYLESTDDQETPGKVFVKDDFERFNKKKDE